MFVCDCIIGLFNPRSHVGSDCLHAFAVKLRVVSIHAPTWGATVGLLILVGHAEVSIHAPTWGATIRGAYCPVEGVFQSTLPRGERHDKRFNPKGGKGFNPRSHVGSDEDYAGKILTAEVSIHAPTWGATALRLLDVVYEAFQSTLPRGERLKDSSSVVL